jgi:hypothetical protein
MRRRRRVVRSEAELHAVAPDSLVCAAYAPASVYQVGGDGRWSEPGLEEEIPTPALWEFLTGAYETIILDEDREVWVLYDSAAQRDVRPRHGEDSHGRQTVRYAFKKTHEQGVTFLTSIIAMVVDAILGKLVPELGVTMFDALGLSDDRMSGCRVALTAREMVVMAARGTDSNFQGIDYRFESPMVTGLGAEYTLYFSLVPA